MSFSTNALVSGFVFACIVFFAFSGRVCAGQADSIATPVSKPVLHHILIEVADVGASLKFYRDCLGLSLASNSNGFATLESANAGVYLWQHRCGWENERDSRKSRGWGLYPHFELADVAKAVQRFRKSGYTIVQEPRNYDWGTEAFVRDPDGYVIALVMLREGR
jgi:catechol 2,3-dioxygenase-like lactoylglutathione lyase family enzyme